jgi:hypothetical protein
MPSPLKSARACGYENIWHLKSFCPLWHSWHSQNSYHSWYVSPAQGRRFRGILRGPIKIEHYWAVVNLESLETRMQMGGEGAAALFRLTTGNPVHLPVCSGSFFSLSCYSSRVLKRVRFPQSWVVGVLTWIYTRSNGNSFRSEHRQLKIGETELFSKL